MTFYVKTLVSMQLKKNTETLWQILETENETAYDGIKRNKI